MLKDLSQALNKVVVVSALGYFVDIYDLVLFSIVRVPSLQSLGLAPEAVLTEGVTLLNMQMTGMLLGGILWGILGDKRGRVSVLFGSIFMYSLANFANAFVTTIPMYQFLRFIAGIGLAGELGAAVTLVSETLSKQHRGLGTMIITGLGILGAVVAALVVEMFSWRAAYAVGGVLGFALLGMRFGILDSKMFSATVEKNVSRGRFLSLFTHVSRLRKYMSCVLVGLPIWFSVGILVTFSPEIARELGVRGEVSAGKAIMFSYMGGVVGDFISGTLSHLLKSRKQVVWMNLIWITLFIFVYLYAEGLGVTQFYAVIFLLGVGIGYWAIFVTMAAEQFGTNIRATVTTTAPNFVRGAVVPLTIAFSLLRTHFSLQVSALSVGLFTVAVAALSLRHLDETFGKDLDFFE